MHPQDVPFLPGFPSRFGRPRRKLAEKLARQVEAFKSKQVAELRVLFGPWVDARLLEPSASKEYSRRRVFSLEVVFWAYLYQLLSGLGCTGTVKQVQAWMIHQGRALPSSNTSGYCQARRKLPQSTLDTIFKRTGTVLEAGSRSAERWCNRRVKVVDGTGLSMPDTQENQAPWPQSGNCTPGCGFPQLKMVGLFSLCSGALLGYAEGNKHDGEATLWRRLWGQLNPRDIVLGDRGFGSFPSIAGLQLQGVDSVCRISSISRKTDMRRGQRLGVLDRIQVWNRRSGHRNKKWSTDDWNALPKSIQVRIVQRVIEIPGFRSQKITLATTLLDPIEYPAEDLVELYRRRWTVEVQFRDIKETLGMAILSSKTPVQIRKELAMYAICHNLIRGLMQQAAHEHATPIDRISFKGAVNQLSEWLWLFMNASQPHQKLIANFHAALVSSPLPDRPNRVEPRVRKRRPKNYRLMTRPRRKKAVVKKS